MKRIFLLLCLFLISAQTPPTGVGVIGDSNSEPYRCIGRGIASSFNWAETLASQRAIDFGAGVCQDYNKAVSGGSIANDIIPQAQAVAADWTAGRIQKVIFFIGYNDFYIYGKTVNDVPGLLNKTQTAITTLLAAGIPSQSILLTDVAVNSNPNIPQSIRDTVALYNTGLSNLAIQYNTRFISQIAMYNDAWRQVPGGLTVGGQTFTNTAGNEPHNLFIADGHAGTVFQGLMANNLFASFLGIAPLSDNELLSQAGLLTSPTLTKTPTRTPTPSRTPIATKTKTPTPTSTPVFTFFTCPVGSAHFTQINAVTIKLWCE